MNEFQLNNALEQAKKNDQRAFAYLYDHYWDYLFNYLLKKCHNEELAEDLALKSLARAFDKIHSYNPEYEFGTWLVSISNNIHIDEHRKEKKQQQLTSLEAREYDQLGASTPSPEDLLIISQNLKALKEKIKGLKPNHATILKMRIFDDMSYKEIATITELPINTIKVTLLRAKKVLAQKIEEDVH